jgi:predicted dehydrogenase
MEDPIRFAVVGATGYSAVHLEQVAALAERGRGRLVACAMIDKASHPDTVAELEAGGVRVFDSYAEMLVACRGQADVVTLPVPIHLHGPMAVAALNAGYHVLLEKPAAGCLADVDEMIAARDATGKQCAVGFQQLYSVPIRTLKRYIAEGRLGRVKRIRMMALWPRNPAYYARNTWAGKLFFNGRPVYDSPFHNALAHQVMNMLYLASAQPGCAAYPVHTEAELFRAYPIESFDTGCMRVLTDTDVQLVFAASHACAVTIGPMMELEAEKATVRCQMEKETLVCYADGSMASIAWDDSRARMFDSVVDAVRGNAGEPLCTLEMARPQVACTEAIHRAATIIPIGRGHISQGQEGQLEIAGIEQAVQQAYATGLMFSEIGAPFSAHLRSQI